MKKLMVLLMVLAFSLPMFGLKIAVVDMQKVWGQSKEIKIEKKKMEKMLASSQKELKSREAAIKKLQERAQKEGPMATQEAKQAMAQEYQQKMMELQKLYQEKQQLLQEKDVKAQADFVEKVKKVAMKIAIKKGYDVVFAKEGLLYVEDKFDITKAVIQAVNR